MDEQIKELVEEIKRRKSDLRFLGLNEERIREKVYNELLNWIEEKWSQS